MPYARSFRSEPHRPAPRRQRPHGAVQLAAGRTARTARSSCASRTPTPSARRASPRPASSRTCAGSGSTGTRGPTSAGRTARTGSPSGCISTPRTRTSWWPAATRTTASARRRSSRRTAQADLAAGRPPKYHGTCRSLPSTRRAARIDAGERPVIRFRVPEHVEVTVPAISSAATSPSTRDVIGDFVHRAIRRPAGLQLRGRGRRCADGDHARDPRRGSHFEYAAAGAALPGARLYAAGVRASRRSSWGRTTRRCRSVTARRRSPSSAHAATCLRRCELPGADRLVARAATRNCCRSTSWRGGSRSRTSGTAPASSIPRSWRG